MDLSPTKKIPRTSLTLEFRGNSEAIVENCNISGGIVAADRSSPTVRFA